MIGQDTRRLSAIVSADIVGYSRMMGEDEDGTLAVLRRHRSQFIDRLVAEHGGRIVKTVGDGLLLEFRTILGAVRFSVALQLGMIERQVDVPESRRFVFRVGVHLGDIVIDSEGDIFGDGVNIAARLEAMADPGSVLISHSARESVLDRLDVVLLDNGERKFKNIARPVRVWSWPQKLSGSRAEDKPQIFVAEFEGYSEDEKSLAGALRDELRAHFSRLTGMDVAAEKSKSHYILEGSLRLGPDRSRVFARLVALETEAIIWSDRYDEPTSDAFEILDRYSPRIAMSVRRRVATDHADRAAHRPLEELSLEQLLAVAGRSFFTPTYKGWEGGGLIAEQALELAPQNFMALAIAAAGLGLAEALFGFRKTEEAVFKLAIKRIEQALRLTNRSDMVNGTHSMLLLFGLQRHGDATVAAQRSLELNSDFNMGYWALASARVFAGDHDAGIELAKKAVSIDTRDPYVHLYSRVVAYGYLHAAQYSEAAEWFQKADHLAPRLAPNLIGLAVCYSLSGDHARAHESVVRLLEEEPTFRISVMHPLPFRDETICTKFADSLRLAGAPG